MADTSNVLEMNGKRIRYTENRIESEAMYNKESQVGRFDDDGLVGRRRIVRMGCERILDRRRELPGRDGTHRRRQRRRSVQREDGQPLVGVLGRPLRRSAARQRAQREADRGAGQAESEQQQVQVASERDVETYRHIFSVISIP